MWVGWSITGCRHSALDCSLAMHAHNCLVGKQVNPRQHAIPLPIPPINLEHANLHVLRSLFYSSTMNLMCVLFAQARNV